jgi:hypothetical protein
MAASVVGCIVAVALLLAPGMHYDMLRGRVAGSTRPVSSPQVGRVVLASVLLATVTLAVLGLVRWLGPRTVLNPRLLAEDGTYLVRSLVLASWTATCFLALSLTIAALAAAAHTRIEKVSAIAGSGLHSPAVPGGGQSDVLTPDVELEVKLNNGDTYRGLFDDYSQETDPGERQLVLEGPIFHVDDLGKPLPLDPVNWHRLVVPRSAIVSILVRHVDGGWKSGNTRMSPRLKSYPRHSSPRRDAAGQLKWFLHWCYERRSDPYMLARLLGVELLLLAFVALLARAVG